MLDTERRFADICICQIVRQITGQPLGGKSGESVIAFFGWLAGSPRYGDSIGAHRLRVSGATLRCAHS